MCILVERKQTAFCFPGKQYLIHQKMILITIPCQKNGREDLRGEKANVLEANQMAVPKPSSDWER